MGCLFNEFNERKTMMAMITNPQPEELSLNPDDPWVHRSEGMRCCTCMFFAAKLRVNGPGTKSIGRCRRHAPIMSGYPVVFDYDWCGDHKLDENKTT